MAHYSSKPCSEEDCCCRGTIESEECGFTWTTENAVEARIVNSIDEILDAAVGTGEPLSGGLGDPANGTYRLQVRCKTTSFWIEADRITYTSNEECNPPNCCETWPEDYEFVLTGTGIMASAGSTGVVPVFGTSGGCVAYYSTPGAPFGICDSAIGAESVIGPNWWPTAVRIGSGPFHDHVYLYNQIISATKLFQPPISFLEIGASYRLLYANDPPWCPSSSDFFVNNVGTRRQITCTAENILFITWNQPEVILHGGLATIPAFTLRARVALP